MQASRSSAARPANPLADTDTQSREVPHEAIQRAAGLLPVHRRMCRIGRHAPGNRRLPSSPRRSLRLRLLLSNPKNSSRRSTPSKRRVHWNRRSRTPRSPKVRSASRSRSERSRNRRTPAPHRHTPASDMRFRYLMNFRNTPGLYRIRIGSFATREEARIQLTRMKIRIPARIQGFVHCTGKEVDMRVMLLIAFALLIAGCGSTKESGTGKPGGIGGCDPRLRGRIPAVGPRPAETAHARPHSAAQRFHVNEPGGRSRSPRHRRR